MSNKLKGFLILTLIIGSVFLLTSQSLAVDAGIDSSVSNPLNLGDSSPLSIVKNIINLLMGFLGLIAVCLILWGGFVYMTSGGSEDKIDQAKKIIRNGVIGLVIILSAWGIVYFVINKLLGVTGGEGTGSNSCTSGSTLSCGCGGAQTCNGGTWGPCLGSTCLPSVDDKTSCDGNSADAKCQADNNLCGSDYTCDADSCLCKPKASLGESCNANSSDNKCTVDDNLCGPYLKCNPDSCTCVGAPVITGVSPAGGFCNNDKNRGCNLDSDCLGGAKCDISTPNGGANNFITIYGYNFGTSSNVFESFLTNIDFEKGDLGKVPTDWTTASQKHSVVGIVQDQFRSGKQSVKIHQDANQEYPGSCNKATCDDLSNCTWKAADNTCNFLGTDDAHRNGPAVYKQGEILIWGNSHNVMWAKLTYNLAPLNFKVGETYSIQFYYKGKTTSNVAVQISPNLGWSNQCVAYSYYAALKPGYTWDGSKIVPTPAEGVDPCGMGKTCPEQANACCMNTPYQKKCYGSLNLTSIPAGSISDWTLYSYTFKYTPEMNTWLNASGQKMIELGLSVGYNNTKTGTDLYIDDFTVTKVLNTGQVTFLGANESQSQLANFPKLLNSNCVSSWTDRQITVAVPSGAANGPIQVKREGNFEDNVDTTSNDSGPKIADFVKNEIYRPGLCLIDPVQGSLGDKVGYQGVNLKNSTAYFGQYSNSYKGINSVFSTDNLSGQTFAPSIVPGQTTTFVERSLSGINQKSNALVFLKERDAEAGPYISSFYPTFGSAGQYITISGKGFGNMKGSRQVFFDDKEASYDFPEVCANSVWSDSQIIVKVPNGLVAKNYKISIKLGEKTINTDLLTPNNTFKFDPTQVLKTSICKIDPSRGQIGDKVSLWGEYFGTKDTYASVVFNREISTSSKIIKDGLADKLETVVPINNEGISAITGPVKVMKNGVSGNEVNFTVGKCTNNSECGASSPVCCPTNTYKTGSCATSLLSCYFDVPNSVYETKFNTILSGVNPNEEFDSCLGMAAFYGACQTGQFCPNSPGKCSPFDSILPTATKDCGSAESECGAFKYCKDNASDCTYNKAKDVCQAKKCIIEKEISYSLAGSNTVYKGISSCRAYDDKTTNKTYFVRQIKVNTSCPDNYINIGEGYCVDTAPILCDPCANEFTCNEDANTKDNFGICESKKICGNGASCEKNGNKFSCFEVKNKSCECCCEIGQDARDCCAPLKCAGTCGSDTTDNGEGYGSCSGCSAVGSTQAEHDAACNCDTTSGKICDTSKSGGVCTDCASLDEASCGSHKDQCCFDAVKGVCRGGDGNLLNGKCAYYDCDAKNKATCNQTATTTGQFLATSTCVTTCAKTSKTICDLIGNDPIKCSAQSSCCYDGKNNKCVDGTEKFTLENTEEPNSSEGYNGNTQNKSIQYCAYYNCDTNTKACNGIASTTGQIIGKEACDKACGSGETFPAVSCSSDTANVCNTSLCGNPLRCLNSDGKDPSSSDCGFCCCTPGEKNGDLTCLADKGNCNGSSRGLFCGCSSDNQCGSPSSQGCGSDTCCYGRPIVTSTKPENDATRVCRNAQIEIKFNQEMNVTTFPDNILLLEEKNYNTDTCPNGTTLSLNNFKPKRINFIARVYQTVFNNFKYLFSGSTGLDAIAAGIDPSADKLYCVIPATIENKISYTNGATSTKILLRPQKLLAAQTNYFVVVKGDENLDSNHGVMSLNKVGLNGNSLTNSKRIANPEFNGLTFKNSFTFAFETLSSNDDGSGVCVLDKVVLEPDSFLINKVDNDVSDDVAGNLQLFDTKDDSDRAVSAWAYSADNQLIQPVSGYNWDWVFKIDDPSVVSKLDISGLKNNQIVVGAVSGVTDKSTKITATVNMNNYTNNISNQGNGFKGSSDAYVFLCANPWPMVSGGKWSPWSDKSTASDGTGVSNYNYKFYYCRDAGAEGTADDLPAVADPALILGSSGNLVCSNSGVACSEQGAACGVGGTCIWDVLKESYFFREAIPQSGEITEVRSTGTGDSVLLNWYAPITSNVTLESFKIYYGLADGKSVSSIITVLANDTNKCSKTADKYSCSFTISNLIKDKKYYFKVSSLTGKKAESPLSGGAEATPVDNTAPAKPLQLEIKATGTSFTISWKANTDDTLYYRLFHGFLSGKRASDSVDSPSKATSLTFNQSNYRVGDHFFYLAAIDESGNISETSDEIKINVPAAPTNLNISQSTDKDTITIDWNNNFSDDFTYYIFADKSDAETLIGNTKQKSFSWPRTLLGKTNYEKGEYYFSVSVKNSQNVVSSKTEKVKFVIN